MKIKFFKGTSKAGKPYWYIPAKNYKDANDKLTYYVSFTKDCGEPISVKATTPTGNTYEYADVDVLQMFFGCYQGKPQITIAKIMGETQSNTFYAKDIKSDDLPFDF